MNIRRIFAITLTIGFLLGGCGTKGEQASIQPTPSSTPNPNVTVCASGCDFSSIRSAVEAESTQPGAIIEVKDPVHTEGGIQVSKNVIIQGQGAEKTIVQAHPTPGEGTQRVFEVPLGTDVTIRGMTIRHGNPKAKPLTGGGILNYGTLVLENTVISENFGSAGGGIYNEGTLTLVNSTIGNNGSVGGGEAYLECETGGGMKILSGTVTLINSTISNNKASGKGGGVHVACSGILVLQNSTISGNFSSGSGGGVFLNGVGEFTNSTISNNSASNVGGINIEGSGENNLIRGQLSMTNTIIANNVGRLETYSITDCYMNKHATMIVNQSNWIGDGNCTPAFSGDPMLGELADNGGPTMTHSLLPGSPAIDVIPDGDCTLNTDQRGEPRLAPCDIGAFEVQMP